DTPAPPSFPTRCSSDLSRYGVFFEHHLPLAYRANASAALDLTPARVYRNDDGTAYFQLCKGDDDWRRHSREGNKVQYAAWVPARSEEHTSELQSRANLV